MALLLCRRTILLLPWLIFVYRFSWNSSAVLATTADDNEELERINDLLDLSPDTEHTKGPNAAQRADYYWNQGNYPQAAMHYWQAVLFHTQTPPALQTYDVQATFERFLQCYAHQGQPVEGLAFVSMESFRRGQVDMGKQFLQQALDMDPHNEAALAVQREFGGGSGSKPQKAQSTSSASQQQKQNSQKKKKQSSLVDESDTELYGKSPEELYAVASGYFSDKDYESCADIFEISCQLSEEQLGPSCANAVYCRTMIADWGWNGTQHAADMQRIVDLTATEAKHYRVELGGSNEFQWQRATSVHPHMMLGYPLDDLMLKRYVAESVASMDEMMARAGHSAQGAMSSSDLTPLPEDMPFSTDPARWIQEKQETEDYRIRVGFVGSGFNSKAVLYLSHDMFRFFDKTRFEIHVFAFNAPDHALFLEHGMRGVDWRKRVQSNVDSFHDLQHLRDNHVEAARYVHDQRIHILLEWDGYARQGERAQGLLGLRPAPVQMLHQEYLGTSGAANDVDYLFTDAITSPPELQRYYTEKLIYLPNHFFSKGHAMQAEVHPPSHEYAPRGSGGYQLGTGTPQENRCLAPASVGPDKVSFVFCNWNKLLKNNPETMRSWIEILRRVPNSMLCLLENPASGVPYLRRFVHEAAATTARDRSVSWSDEGDALNDRIQFLPWERNPFDHQRRNVDFCNVMLDSHPYNGHTVAQDALYAGVPIVTRSDGTDMASRVTTSANAVLGLSEHLNAYQGTQHYQDLAVALATNHTLFASIRQKLIDSALQRNPMHPYWDVPRYVKNFETGLETAWHAFLRGASPHDHIYVHETERSERGTYNDEIDAHPPEGPRHQQVPE